MTILVINPNSSAAVTEGIARALAPMSDRFEVVGLPQGPATIASAGDVARAGIAVADTIAAHSGAGAYVSACFSDPGVEIARDLTPKPVLGIQEAGILTAMARADLFGIIAMAPGSIPRHRRKIRQMGVESRLADEIALPPGATAEATGRDPALYARAVEIATELKARGAGAVVLGCAGMTPIRARLEADAGIAVIDPVLAAAAMALGLVPAD